MDRPEIRRYQGKRISHRFTAPSISPMKVLNAEQTVEGLTNEWANSSELVKLKDRIIVQGEKSVLRYTADITVEKLDQDLLSEITRRNYLSKRVKELYPGCQISNGGALEKFRQSLSTVRGWLPHGGTQGE